MAPEVLIAGKQSVVYLGMKAISQSTHSHWRIDRNSTSSYQ